MILNMTGGDSNTLTSKNSINTYTIAPSSKIDKGDFINFFESAWNTNMTEISSNENTGAYIAATEIDDNTIFVTYTSNSNLYGAICTVNGDSLSLSSDVLIDNIPSNSNYSKIVTIKKNQVFVAYATSNFLYATVCTIDNGVITVNPRVLLASDTTQNPDSRYMDIGKLDNERVFVVIKMTYLAMVVCRVADGKITVGEKKDITTSTGYGNVGVAAATIDSNRVFITYNQGVTSSSYAYAVICSIKDLTITSIGTETRVTGSSRTGYVRSAMYMSNNIVAVTHAINSSYYLAVSTCKIDDMSFTPVTTVSHSGSDHQDTGSLAIKLDNNKILTTLDVGCFGLCLCNMSSDGLNITFTDVSKNYNYNEWYTAPVLLSNGTIVVFTQNETTTGLSALVKPQILVAKADTVSCNGVALENGLAGETIKVLTPRFSY